jgi:hypothetical protein
MPEIGTSGSMSGDGKRSVAAWPKLPRPSSTLPIAAMMSQRGERSKGAMCGHWLSLWRSSGEILNHGCKSLRSDFHRAGERMIDGHNGQQPGKDQD